MDAKGVLTSLAVALAAGLIAPLGARAAVPTLPDGFESQPLATGLTQPVMAAWAPDGRMFVVEKFGQLEVVPANSTTPRPILSIPNEVNEASDRGMLGVAVDGQFDQGHPYVYVLYTKELKPSDPDAPTNPAISTLERLTIGTNSAVTARKRILGTQGPAGGTDTCPAPTNDVDCIPSEGSSHSIGTVRSAPDGTLFVGSGDASNYDDLDPRATGTQDEQSMRGKIMHIDRDGKGVSGHPFCATDTNLSHVCTKLFAKGFRNPFRFQRLGDGRLSVGDVGWNTTEEIDLIPATGGRNYGWPCYEGPNRTPGYTELQVCKDLYAREGTATAATPPNYSYDHNIPKPDDLTTGHTAISGPVYTSTTGGLKQYPSQYRNRLFFADFVGDGTRDVDNEPVGFIKSLDISGSPFAPPNPFVPDLTTVALEKAPNGNLAYVSIGDFSEGSGSVNEIRYVQQNRSPTAVATASPTSARPGQAVRFDGSRSSDPDEDSLTYSWAFSDGATASGATPSHQFASAGCYTARLTVRDPEGKTAQTTVTVPVAATPLAATIDSAAPYRVGDEVTLTGSGSGGSNAAGIQYSWRVTLRHGTHSHPVTGRTSAGGRSLTFTTDSDHDSDSFYMAELTATDPNAGCSATAAAVTATREVRPETHRLTIASNPVGAELAWSGTSSATGYSYDAATGFASTVTAPATAVIGGREHRFTGWSDGGARSHRVTVPATNLNLVASYEPVADPPATEDPAPSTPAPSTPAPSTPSPLPSLPAPQPGTPPVSPFPAPAKKARDRKAPGVAVSTTALRSTGSAVVRGTASDTSGIKRVELLLAAQPAGSRRCQFWSAKTKRLGSSRPCSKPVWNTARLRRLGRGRVAWSVAPWKRAVPGRWLMRVRVTDRAGNRYTLERPLPVSG